MAGLEQATSPPGSTRRPSSTRSGASQESTNTRSTNNSAKSNNSSVKSFFSSTFGWGGDGGAREEGLERRDKAEMWQILSMGEVGCYVDVGEWVGR